jgi:3-hydroxyacyl-[acyl-carrier-protein] dehydratase
MNPETDIHSMLPWSHPFRMVDRMVSCVPHERAVTCKCVSAGDAVMPRGDGREVFFPSVLVLEGLSQTAALLFRLSYGPDALVRAPMLGYLDAKIRGSAKPGDTLTYTVTAVKMTRRSGIFEGVAHVDLTLIASTELAFGTGAP